MNWIKKNIEDNEYNKLMKIASGNGFYRKNASELNLLYMFLSEKHNDWDRYFDVLQKEKNSRFRELLQSYKKYIDVELRKEALIDKTINISNPEVGDLKLCLIHMHSSCISNGHWGVNPVVRATFFGERWEIWFNDEKQDYDVFVEGVLTTNEPRKTFKMVFLDKYYDKDFRDWENALHKELGLPSLFMEERATIGKTVVGSLTNTEQLKNTEQIRTELKTMGRREFVLNKMLNAQEFDLSEENIEKYFALISLFADAHKYNAFRHMKEKRPMESLSERQLICSENAINCLFEHDFTQALHETLDVLSDYNKDSPLSYNEYVILQNILTIYNNLKQPTIQQ